MSAGDLSLSHLSDEVRCATSQTQQQVKVGVINRNCRNFYTKFFSFIVEQEIRIQSKETQKTRKQIQAWPHFTNLLVALALRATAIPRATTQSQVAVGIKGSNNFAESESNTESLSAIIEFF